MNFVNYTILKKETICLNYTPAIRQGMISKKFLAYQVPILSIKTIGNYFHIRLENGTLDFDSRDEEIESFYKIN